MLYYVAGWLNALFFSICVFGLWLQLRTIWRRKLTDSFPGQRPTAVLSLNHFAVRFFAFYVYFVFGLTADPFNHYLVWPRLPAIALSLMIIWEIFADRKDKVSRITFAACVLLMIIALAGWGFGDLVPVHHKSLSQALVIGMALLILQSDLHQIHRIREQGDTGAVELKTVQTTFLKDLSTVFLGCTMGVSEGWPLVLGSGSSALMKGLLMYQFRWVAKSPIAKERRSIA